MSEGTTRLLARRALVPHPETPPRAEFAIEAAVLIGPEGDWTVQYTMMGDLDAIVVPAKAPPERTDELWRTTCFELFERVDDTGYREYNFAPSGQWAAYRFDDYRAGMAPLELAQPVTVARFVSRRALSLHVAMPAPLEARLGLSAVIEEKDGTKSYWALAHPPGRPDFHHPDCFALQLPAPEGA